MNSKVLVVGGSGMLGSAMVSELGSRGLSITATARDASRFSNATVSWRPFSVGGSNLEELVSDLGDGDYVVNCIGLIKHHMDDSEKSSRHQAILVNSLFPYTLAQLAEQQGFQVIQIATDCVFAGKTGGYSETALHDAKDVYGKSKSLGEVPSPNVLNIRCSIVGEEPEGGPSLIGWLLSQEPGATISGYTDHIWNGVTTAAFARMVAGLVSARSKLAGSYHWVPAGAINKSDLSTLILEVLGRTDVQVIPTVTGNPIDRTLSTANPDVNQHLWEVAGFSEPPKIEMMIRSLARP